MTRYDIVGGPANGQQVSLDDSDTKVTIDDTVYVPIELKVQFKGQTFKILIPAGSIPLDAVNDLVNYMARRQT